MNEDELEHSSSGPYQMTDIQYLQELKVFTLLDTYPDTSREDIFC